MLIAVAIIIVLYLFSLLKGMRVSGIFAGILLYEITLLLSTVYRGGDYIGCITAAVRTVSMCMLIEIMLRDDPGLCLDVLLPPLEFLVYANLLTMLLFPNGMYQEWHYIWNSGDCWLLGFDNTHICFILPAITVSFLHTYYYKNKAISIRNWLLLLASYTSVLLRWSATSVVGLIILGIYIFIPRLFKRTGVFNIRNYILINAGLFIAIVLLRLQDHFAFFIQDFLGKSLTFTGRTFVWDNSISWIMTKPWLGSGVESSEKVFNAIGQVNSHNQYLWDLYRGGVARFGCLVSILVLAAKQLMKFRKIKAAQLLSVSLLCVLVMWQFEAFGTILIFLLIMLAYYVEELLPQADALQTEKVENYADA